MTSIPLWQWLLAVVLVSLGAFALLRPSLALTSIQRMVKHLPRWYVLSSGSWMFEEMSPGFNKRVLQIFGLVLLTIGGSIILDMLGYHELVDRVFFAAWEVFGDQ
ncbi:MAG: hypothetical protein WBO54_15575 [Thermoanaerobaculia bacterium]